MKKRILALLLAVSLLSCAGCGGDSGNSTTTTTGSSATDEAPTDVNVADVTKAVLDEIPINSAFEKTADTLGDYFDKLDTDTLESSSYYLCASGAYPDEIAVFKFKDEASAKSAVSAVNDRLENQIEMYETYTPDEMYKLEGAVVKQSGVYVYYLVTSDNEKAESIVKGFIK